MIIAENAVCEALPTLVVNKKRGTLNVCAVSAPVLGGRIKAIVKDIDTLIDGKFIS